MSQNTMPLYPKISSIYNKIMQLAIAIVLILVLLNLWVDNERQYNAAVTEHFYFTSRQIAQQTADTINVITPKKQSSLLKQLFSQLSNNSLIHDALLYDKTGQTIASTKDAKTINDLYGISLNKLNLSEKYVPVVVNINTPTFHGYLRVTFVKGLFEDTLLSQNRNQQQLVRLMLLLAGVAGFLLTRGLNRFSRQGYRIARPKTSLK